MGAGDTLLRAVMPRWIYSKRVSADKRTAEAPGLSPGPPQALRGQEIEKELAKEKGEANLISWKPREKMTNCAQCC